MYEMPNIVMKRIKKRGGGTRLQKVQILASGKWKFLKNPKTVKKTSSKTTPSKRKTSSASTKRKTNVTNKGKMFRTLGATGALEDFAWGFGGLVLMGANN
ncbi:unnamed protein product, partial [marine sediment metagenome]